MGPLTINTTLRLPNSVEIPQLGFGVYQSPRNLCIQSCLTALQNGYRHIDTAQYYGNELEVGQAVKQSGLPRRDIFLTTKILSAAGSTEATYQKCVESVQKLNPGAEGYVDLFLIHSPNCGAAQRNELWQALERLLDEGKTRSIGVSNFGLRHIEELKQFAKVWPPHVNQIEVSYGQLHPWLQQREIVEYCQKHGIVVEAYCPLVRNTKVEDATLGGIARKHSTTPSQILIRYCLEKGWVPLPKSDNPERIRANAEVFGFRLDSEDMNALDGLDRGPAGAIVQAISRFASSKRKGVGVAHDVFEHLLRTSMTSHPVPSAHAKTSTPKMAVDSGAKRYAYVTLITRQSYLAGVIILAYTLAHHGSNYPLVVCYTPKLSRDATRALELEAPRSHMVLCRCDPLLPPEGTPINLIAERFADTWSKLRVFERTFEYDAVCYLDADMAVFQNMDAVFAHEAKLPPDGLLANHACVCNLEADPWAPDTWRPENCAYTPLSHPSALTEPTQPPTADDGPETHHLLNGGMFLFRPSPALWEDMLALFRTTPLLSTFRFPDQDFLALLFRGRWRALGWQYNAIKTMRYWHPNIWHDEAVVCLHYIVDKPWTKRIGRDGVAGYKGRDGVTHRWWWDAYQAWEDDRLKNGAGDGAETVALVRKGVAPPRWEGSEEWAFEGDDPDMKALGSNVQGMAYNKTFRAG
ncbi:glycosyltransferase family 8 protein [Parathielavia appendiculata]|uniref:Glycosyltransferase family 8 protein n=1 Tax=Parathielavia appendiculata TaxID=2587402 RepID=A0AAN6TPC2_9PEZI|nr:glycosyltransferase family 8 protein [Parathielavia appendiculata]